MRQTSRLGLVIALVVAVCVPIMLSLTVVRLLFTEQFLVLEYSRSNFPADSYGFTTADRLAYAPIVLEYLVAGNDVEVLTALRFDDGSVVFGEREIRHLVDVWRVVQVVLWVLVLVAIVLFLSVLLSFCNMTIRSHIMSGLRAGGYLTLGIIGGLIAAALVAWNRFFELFHGIFFENGTWRFYYSDTLIRLFPEQFWFDAALIIGTLTALGAIGIILLVSIVQRRFSARSHNHAMDQ